MFLLHAVVVFHQHMGMSRERDPGTFWVCSLELAWINLAQSLSHIPELIMFLLQMAEESSSGENRLVVLGDLASRNLSFPHL